MRFIWSGFEFGMELDADHPGVVFNLDYFHQVEIGIDPGDPQSPLFQVIPVEIIEFIPMTVSFGNFSPAVCFVAQGIFGQFSRTGAQAHAAAVLLFL